MYRITTHSQTTRGERDDKLAGSARINRRLAAAGSLRCAALQGSNGKLLIRKKKKCTTYPRGYSARFPYGGKANKKTHQADVNAKEVTVTSEIKETRSELKRR